MRLILIFAAAAVLHLVPAHPAAAQQHAAAAPAEQRQPPAPRTADVESIDAIIAALYDVISGPIGAARDWDRFRSLFADGARLIPVGRRPDGSGVMNVMTPEDYVTVAGPQLEASGFRERELARTEDRFGDVVHAFSSYEGTLEREGRTIRGINSIQLRYDGARWWVVTVFWQAERPDLPLPERYRGR